MWIVIIIIVIGGIFLFYNHIQGETNEGLQQICRQLRDNGAKCFSCRTVHDCGANLPDGRAIFVKKYTCCPWYDGPERKWVRFPNNK